MQSACLRSRRLNPLAGGTDPEGTRPEGPAPYRMLFDFVEDGMVRSDHAKP